GRTGCLIVAQLTVRGALMVFLIARIPLAGVAQSLRSARPEWLSAACGLLVLSNLIGAYQWWRLLLAVEIRIPLWKACAYYHVGLFFNNFLPANIGGDLARIADASRHGPTRAAALPTVLLDRMIAALALAGLALVTTPPAIDAFPLRLAYLALGAFFARSVPLLAVIVSLPISFNGIGVREGAGVVLFGLVGVSRAHAFSLQFTTYLVGVAVSLLGGVTFLARLPLRRAGARPMEGSS